MPLLWCSLSFLVGVLIAGAVSLPLPVWIAVGCLGIILSFSEKFFHLPVQTINRLRSVVPLAPGILLVFVALGGFRYLAGEIAISERSLAFYNDRGVYTIIARVSAPPDLREDAVYLDLGAIEIEDPRATDPLRSNRDITGNLRVRLPAYAEYRIGDILRFTGSPLTPGEDAHFSYKDYLARQHISTVMYYPRNIVVVDHIANGTIREWLEILRQQGKRVIFSQYPQPESGLLSGILLGLDKDLPGSLVRAYQQTGTAHIIAISGFNMGILALAFAWIFNRFMNRYWAALFTGIALIIYTILVGGSPSVVRASVMAVTALAGFLIGRRQSGINALGFTAALMCLVNPLLLWDVSFQLSFAATFGLVLFAEPLRTWLDSQLLARLAEDRAVKVSTPIYQYFLLTLAAQVMTIPIIAYHFGRISLSSLLANPLILPVQPPLLILGGVSVMIGGFVPVLGKAISLCVWPLAAYSNLVAHTLSRFQKMELSVNQSSALWLAVILGVFLLLFVFRKFLKKIFKSNFPWIIFFLLIGSVSVISIVFHRPDGQLHIDLLPSGEEAVLLMRTPAGQSLLFDPGKEVNELSSTVSPELSPWNYRIDAVWLSHRAVARNLSGLNERLPLRSVILPSVVYRAGADAKPLEVPNQITLVKLQPGSVVDYSQGLTVSVLAESHDSAAFLITHGSVKILIPNGVEFTLLNSTDPAALSGLSALVLNESDISYIPPRVWQQLSPGLVLWNSQSVIPFDTWLGPREEGRIKLVSDGRELLISSSP